MAKLPVFSLLRRPPRRRNSLREKLIPRQDQVPFFPELSNNESNLESLCLREHEINGHGLDMNLGGVNELAAAGDSKKFDLSKNSLLWDKLDNWMDRFKEDSEFWGIGTGPIFTIFQSSDGNVNRVSVNEDEILKRNRIRAFSLESDEENGEIKDVNFKISRARAIAKGIETGSHHMPRNSSIAKFVVDEKMSSSSSSLDCLFHAFSSRRGNLIKIFPGIGLTVLCCFCVLGIARRLFAGYKNAELTREEVEMLRRKKKSRMERKEIQRGSVEVLQNGDELPVISSNVPQLNRDEVMKSILQSKKSSDTLVLSDPSHQFNAKSYDFDRKVREIRNMVRKVHEVEHQNQSSNSHTGEQVDLMSIKTDTEFQHLGSENHAHYKEKSAEENNTLDHINILSEDQANSIGEFSQGESLNSFGTSRINNVVDIEGQETSFLTNSQKILVGIDMSGTGSQGAVSLSNKLDVKRDMEDNNSVSCEQTGKSSPSTNKRGIPKIITSVKEANEYLNNKCRIPIGSVQPEQPIHLKGAAEVLTNHVDSFDGNLERIQESADISFDLDDALMGHNGDIKLDCLVSGTKIHNETSHHYKKQDCCDHTFQTIQIAQSKDFQSDDSLLSVTLGEDDELMLRKLSGTEELDIRLDRQLDEAAEVGRSEYVITVPDAMTNETNVRNYSDNDNVSQSYPVGNGVFGSFKPGTVNASFSSKSEDALNDISSKESTSSSSSNSESLNENLPLTNRKSWVEDNFQQFDSIIEKIGIGFKDNYALAKVKAQENSLSSSEIGKLCMWGEDEELEWMKDENLLEIVFQVRENELAGRDPFYSMDADDQRAFFLGLEHKAEKVNEKLSGVHEWIHSRIENLDYGADGISLDDPLEKIIPRWKGPPIDQDPEFLKKFTNTGSSVLAENIRNLDYISGAEKESFQKLGKNPNSDGVSPYSPVNDIINLSEKGKSTPPKTVIECSDGSSRPGKKKMKEQWQHTKKWSQGFLEVYNSETDPEVKSILKDMGKDLDRWITDKEIKDAADQMTRMPKKKRRFIEKKMNKVKREVEKYGAQAVISKYKEYAGEKDEDYLWWLDLPFILCIELYYVEDDVPRIGFYSLEMAEDLELNPKQHHVIAFEDAGDSKNFCYILQAQMDMQGIGKAFVVARPPKDAFREAKATGFGLTLIRKGEIKINVDQTLVEVEEELKEHGSKIYHDKIMTERRVDVRSLVKGVISASKSVKR